MYSTCHLVVSIFSCINFLSRLYSLLPLFRVVFLFFTYYEISVRLNEFYTFRSRKHLLPTSSSKDHRGAHACLWHNHFFFSILVE